MARQIAMVKSQVSLKTHDQGVEDIEYWLSRTPQERIAAVTFLVNQFLSPGQRMDKTAYSKRNLK